MKPRAFLAAVRRWWPVVVAAVAVGLFVGWVSAPGALKTRAGFEASHILLPDYEQGDLPSINRAPALATLGPVPERVAAKVGIDRKSLQSMVSARFEPPGVLVITARSGSADQAEALANTIAQELMAELGGSGAPFRTLEQAMASPRESDDSEGPRSRPARALMLGGIGLLLGLGAALALDRFEGRIGTRKAAEAALGFPVMAEIPGTRRLDSDAGMSNPGSAVFEAYRTLRSAILQWKSQADDRGARQVVAVVSGGDEEGKSFTAAHLAASLAETGRAVLLVSADFRRPRLHTYFGRTCEPGLAEILSGSPGTPELADLDLHTGVDGVSLLTSGVAPRDPAAAPRRIGELLGAVRTGYDLVLLDAPPLLLSGEAADLARQADGVLIVVRARVTSTYEAVRSAEMCRRLDLPVIGTVFLG